MAIHLTHPPSTRPCTYSSQEAPRWPSTCPAQHPPRRAPAHHPPVYLPSSPGVCCLVSSGGPGPGPHAHGCPARSTTESSRLLRMLRQGISSCCCCLWAFITDWAGERLGGGGRGTQPVWVGGVCLRWCMLWVMQAMGHACVSSGATATASLGMRGRSVTDWWSVQVLWLACRVCVCEGLISYVCFLCA